MLLLEALLGVSLLVELLFAMSERTTMFGYRQVVNFQKTFFIMAISLVVPLWVF
jgi:hypothetical protein